MAPSPHLAGSYLEHLIEPRDEKDLTLSNTCWQMDDKTKFAMALSNPVNGNTAVEKVLQNLAELKAPNLLFGVGQQLP